MLKTFRGLKILSPHVSRASNFDMLRLDGETVLLKLLHDVRDAGATPLSIRVEIEGEIDAPQKETDGKVL